MKEQGRGRSRGRGAKRKNRKPWLISLAAAAAAVLVIVSAVAALRGRDTLTIKEPAYLCINGIRTELEAGATLYHKGDSTTIRLGKKKYDLETAPVITADESSIFMQRSCSLNRVDDDCVYRLDYFTRISRDAEGILIKRRNKETRDISGFLYDNSDTYVFLEPVTLSYNDKTVELTPMTIVQVAYMEQIQIFGPGVETVFETVTSEAVTAEFSNKKRVNLATDRCYAVNGAWRLLFMPLEALPEMFSRVLEME